MSFNKKFLPELEEMKRLYESYGHERFIEIYSKADAFVGSTESIEFVKEKLKQKS